MTLNLKLVKQHDGKWTALTPESDDLTQELCVTEKKSAPIDPAQLLKALDSLLSPEGGIRSSEDVIRLANLMKKFSKKLVSRCVYCNVLQATKPEILSEYLDKGGWETINTWLQYAKSSSSESFLLEMLKLCKQLPMTLSRLKENNTAKVIKSLTKHENKAVKILSNEVVSHWMSIIKEKKIIEPTADKKKKKEKSTKVEPPKEENKSPPKSASSSSKTLNRLKGIKRTSTEKGSKPAEIYEDVKIDPEPLMPISKKPRSDRPKTAKIYQKKFRATGLEEETPLPKNITKKTTNVDKTAAVAAAKNTLKLNTNPLDRITEKKLKPESLLAVNETSNSKGIKLIPAKPRPTYILQESASFMDALVSQPITPVRRKKKIPPKSPPPQQTSPTIVPPKLQFYKDTLEEKMSEENKKQEPENKDNETENKDENAKPAVDSEENLPMEVTEDGSPIQPNTEENETSNHTDVSESKDVSEQLPRDPNQLRSILCHGKKRNKKKSVKWVEESHIKEVFYFEMDDTERVNVSRNQNFCDLKSIEMKRERETMELAKKQANDKVEDFYKWWGENTLILDAPNPLVVGGCASVEKVSEQLRQESTLQEIYFTKEMLPESGHEPDLEIVASKEPIVVPLDEETTISTLYDYSVFKRDKPSLPDILTTLMKIKASNFAQVTQNVERMPIPMDIDPIQPPTGNISVEQPNVPMSLSQPVSEIQHVNSNGLLGHAPPLPLYNPADVHGTGQVPVTVPVPVLQGEWQTPDMPPNEFFGGFPMNPNMPLNQPPLLGVNMRGPGVNNFRPNFRGGPRGVGPPRNRKICRHFAAGHCRFGFNCAFLHPGVNGPL